MQETQILAVAPKRLLLDAALIALSSRALVLFILVLASQFSVTTVPAREGSNYCPAIRVETRRVMSSLKKIWLSADAWWYLDIAKNGYHRQAFTADAPHNWPLFPVFPLAVKALSSVTGSFLIAGLLVSNTAFLLALTAVAFAGQAWGLTPSQVRLSLWYLAFFPTSYFYSSPLTESLFLLCLAGTFLLLAKRAFVLSGLLMAVACATRPTGALILPAYAAVLLEQRALLYPRALIGLFLTPLGLLAFSLHLGQITGNPLAFIENQPAWGRTKDNLVTLAGQLTGDPSTVMLSWNFILLNSLIAVSLIALALSFALTRRFSQSLFLGLPVLFLLSTGTVQSISRISMVLFPAFFWLAKNTESTFFERFVLCLFAALLAIMTALYACHVTAAMA